MNSASLGNSVRANPVTLTKEQVKFWDDEGYLVVENVFPDKALDAMSEAAEPLADKDHSVILNIHREVPLFLEVMKNPVLVAMLKTLQRSKMAGLNSQYLFKKAGTPYSKQSWNPHQDNSYTKARKGTTLTLHIFIDRSEKENGGLLYWPGSHKEDILPFEKVKSWREDFDEKGISHPGQSCTIPSQYKGVDIVGPRGGICFQDGHLIHSSYPNLSPTRSRRQYSMFFINEGEPFTQGSTSIKIPVQLEG